MADVGRDAGLGHLIAPVRPGFKDRYPITPIGRYLEWTRPNGEPFDPWVRIHVRRGGKIAKPIPHSMLITGTVAEWESWTGMRFPGDGEYTFPRRAGAGRDRPRARPRLVLGAERLDRPHARGVMHISR